jgi:hypothetical protein
LAGDEIGVAEAAQPCCAHLLGYPEGTPKVHFRGLSLIW